MMSDEVDPMRDLGLTQDRQFICEPVGLLTPADPSRDLFEHFIPNGGHIYDIIEGYDLLTTLVLNSGNTDNGALRYMAPFLKAFDATDYQVSKFFRDTTPLMPNADSMMRYFLDIMPVFLNSSLYEHAADAICEMTGVPVLSAGSTEMELDEFAMTVGEMREIRKIAREIAKIPTPSPNESHAIELNKEEVRIVSFLDDVFQNRFQGNAAAELIHNTHSIGVSEKSYNLVDIRKNTQIDLDCMMYVGGENSDCQVLNLVSDSNGLSIAFNGTDVAVESSKVAVIADDCTVVTFLGSVFFDTGPQGVMDVIADWNRDALAGFDAPDPNLRDRLLEMYPKELPEVYLIDESNSKSIAERSNVYRNKMIDKYRLRRAKVAGDSLSKAASKKKSRHD